VGIRNNFVGARFGLYKNQVNIITQIRISPLIMQKYNLKFYICNHNCIEIFFACALISPTFISLCNTEESIDD
jgi:hypothetical protein